MTERISHAEARRCVGRFPDDDDVELLLAYVDQQQALEADTVSKAEHERKLEEQKDALMGAFRRREEEHERTLATERARAEEAAVIAKSVGDERDNLAAWLAEEKTWRDGMTAELAAANARAGRLDEALERLSQGPWSLRNLETGEDFMQTDADAVIYLATKFEGLSTAPQASTFIHDQGAINEVSPSPAVGEPAQPAPGGTERCSRCGSVDRQDIEGPLLEYGCCRDQWHVPTPAEPQGRPEQAGDRPESDLVAARRCFRIADVDCRHDMEAASDAMCAAIGHILNHLEQLERKAGK